MFPPRSMDAIQRAIERSEATHAGEIRFAVEHALGAVEVLRNASARERGVEVFSALRVWDTEHNNGVLIYFLLADRDFEIVGDRGIHRHVGADGWEAICRRMEALVRAGDFEGGVLDGVAEVSAHLRRHFPSADGGVNELPDQPAVL